MDVHATIPTASCIAAIDAIMQWAEPFMLSSFVVQGK
jgi:hypothetical protein